MNLSNEEREDLLRIRSIDKVRCLSRLPFVRPREAYGCFRLWRKGGTYSCNRFFIPWVSRVSTIYIRHPEYRDSDLISLRSFTGIVAADLGNTTVTDRGIMALASSHETLQYLFLWGTRVGDGIVRFVENMPLLRMLDISTELIDRTTYATVCERLPDCYVIHNRHGRMFRGLAGVDAENAWLSDAA